jgi:hypothetical protein
MYPELGEIVGTAEEASSAFRPGVASATLVLSLGDVRVQHFPQ